MFQQTVFILNLTLHFYLYKTGSTLYTTGNDIRHIVLSLFDPKIK